MRPAEPTRSIGDSDRAHVVWVALAAVILAGCGGPSWWGSEVSANPCRLGLEGAVSEALGSSVLSAAKNEYDYGAWCAYELEGGIDARVEVFHASHPNLLEALREDSRPSVWTEHPGVGDGAGYQDRSFSIDGTLYLRVIQDDVGLDVTIRAHGQRLEPALRSADAIAEAALVSIEQFL